MLKFAMCAWLSRLRSKGGQMLPQSGLSWRGARGVSGPGSLVRPVRLCPETCRPGPGVGPHGDCPNVAWGPAQEDGQHRARWVFGVVLAVWVWGQVWRREGTGNLVRR